MLRNIYRTVLVSFWVFSYTKYMVVNHPQAFTQIIRRSAYTTFVCIHLFVACCRVTWLSGWSYITCCLNKSECSGSKVRQRHLLHKPSNNHSRRYTGPHLHTVFKLLHILKSIHDHSYKCVSLAKLFTACIYSKNRSNLSNSFFLN